MAVFFAWDITDRLHSLICRLSVLASSLEKMPNFTRSLPNIAIEKMHLYLEQYQQIEKEIPTEMAVWALRQNALNEKTELIVLNHLYSEIPNLRAQKGVFVVHRGQIELQARNGNQLPSDTSELMKLDPQRDVVKFTLPFSEEDDLQEIFL